MWTCARSQDRRERALDTARSLPLDDRRRVPGARLNLPTRTSPPMRLPRSCPRARTSLVATLPTGRAPIRAIRATLGEFFPAHFHTRLSSGNLTSSDASASESTPRKAPVRERTRVTAKSGKRKKAVTENRPSGRDSGGNRKGAFSTPARWLWRELNRVW